LAGLSDGFALMGCHTEFHDGKPTGKNSRKQSGLRSDLVVK
jgi:hypothetical protein